MIAAMRRGLVGAMLAALLGAASAWADETITARPVNAFASPVTTIDQGEKVTLQNLDLAGHDVTSHQTGDDGKALFGSALVSPASSGAVAGTEYLTAGNYAFFCSVHPGMEAVLEVTSAGQPVARPETEGLKVKVISTNLDRVVESGKLKLRVTSRKGSVLVGARAEKRKGSLALGSKEVSFTERAERRVVLKLSDDARKKLGKRRRATVIATATANHGGGHTARATARRTLD